MTVKAQLAGHQFDLDALAELYPSGDPHVVRTEDGYFLEFALLDGHFEDAGRMREISTKMLERVNGYARLRDPSFRPARLMDRYIKEDSGSKRIHIHDSDEGRARDAVSVVVAGTAEARLGALRAQIVTDGESTKPVGPRMLALASSNFDVAELLALLGRAPSLSWVELYKVLEIVQYTLGGRQKDLVATGWITKDDLSAFTGTANVPEASGPESRHARSRHQVPSRSLTIEEARRIIRDLANRWLDSL